MYPTVRSLTLPLVIAISIALAGVGPALAASKAPVEVGFVGAPPPNFQNVLLNIQSVRINPNSGASPTDPRWQKINVPAGIGGGGGNSAPTLQIDLNNSQNVPQLFNTAKVRLGNYHIAELVLDPNSPGTLVPNCPKSGTLEGCINYPFQLANAGLPITLIVPKGSSLVSPGKGKLAQLIMQLNVMVTKIPVVPGGSYTVSIGMSAVTNPTLGTVTGTLPTGAGSQAKKTLKLAVTAQTIGTNTEIASAPIDLTTGKYVLALPAASGFGSLYDLAVAGGGDSYGAARLPTLLPNGNIVQNFTNLKTNQTLGHISGRITDNCTAAPIAGATIQLLIPPENNPAVTAADCLDPTTVAECVSVATANTDNAGNFPLPGTLLVPAAFAAVPILPSSAAVNTYAMMVSAPGYDSFLTPANATSGNGTCGSGMSTFPCKIALSTGFISGTIPITPPLPGQTTLVQVFAEDAGTNNIVSALKMPVIVRSTSGGAPPYTINVPTVVTGMPGAARTFDLFATTIDLYQGVTDPYQGHTIAVLSGVTGPLTPPGPGECVPVTGQDFPNDDKITCTGHGSITGTVANADLGSSVVLAKNSVAITNTAVQNQSPSSNNNPLNSYSFCVPGGDTYSVQKFELPTPPTSSPTATSTVTATPTPQLVAPTPVADGNPAFVTVPQAPIVGGPTPTTTSSPSPSATPTGGPTPTPTSTSTPKCPTTCSNPDGSCPGVCNNVGQDL